MNCIGYYNMRFFSLFVFYTFIGLGMFYARYLILKENDHIVWWAKSYFIILNGYLTVCSFLFTTTYAYLIYKGMTLVEKAKMMGGGFVRKK